jgi:hypothetical protein
MPTQEWEENYCLSIGVRLLPLLRSRCKNPTPLLALQSKYVYIQDIFTSFFTLGKAHGWRTSPKCKAGLSYCLIADPLFWECHDPEALP